MKYRWEICRIYRVLAQNMWGYHSKHAGLSFKTCGVITQNMRGYHSKHAGLSFKTCGIVTQNMRSSVPEVVFYLEKSANGCLEVGKNGRWKSISNVRISVSHCLIMIYEKTFSCFLCSCRSGRNTAFSLHLKIQNDRPR